MSKCQACRRLAMNNLHELSTAMFAGLLKLLMLWSLHCVAWLMLRCVWSVCVTCRLMLCAD